MKTLKRSSTAYHFLKEDMTPGRGDEAPWKKGEKRTLERGKIVLCKRGYHSGKTWYDALQYAPGPVACIVKISGDTVEDNQKRASRTRQLVAYKDVSKELRLFACDCAERALMAERKAGREPDKRSWKAVEVARQYAHGKATKRQLSDAAAAAYAAYAAASYAAAYAAYAAASYAAAAYAAAAYAAASYAAAAYAAATSAAASSAAATSAAAAAWAKERTWQAARLNRYMKVVK